MPKFIVVHRYDNPNLFGLHSNQRGYFDTVGLFNMSDLMTEMTKNGPLYSQAVDSIDLDQLASCAPIEWHNQMRAGDETILDRFRVFTTELE